MNCEAGCGQFLNSSKAFKVAFHCISPAEALVKRDKVAHTNLGSDDF